MSGSYESAVIEARALLGDQKALKGATAVCIFKKVYTVVVGNSPPETFFAVRATRADVLKSEGLIEVARIDSGGNLVKL